MATTVANFSAIDDTEVDADSPITETLITRLRDNSYWINEGTNQTTETDATLFLKADGSGGVEWAAAGVDGAKGILDHSSGNLGTSYTTITSATSGILSISGRIGIYASSTHFSTNFTVRVDLSDDSYVYSAAHFNVVPAVTNSAGSGTITTGQTVGYTLNSAGTAGVFRLRRNSGNLQYSSATASQYIVCDWVIL